jgi:hypothetical protein
MVLLVVVGVVPVVGLEFGTAGVGAGGPPQAARKRQRSNEKTRRERLIVSSFEKI